MPLIQGLHQLGETAFQKAGFHLPGMVSLERDFVFSSIILAALVASLIDRKVLRAAGWAAVAALLSWFGVIHAWKITPSGVASTFGWGEAPAAAAGYLVMAVLFVIFGFKLREATHNSGGEEGE